jgi:hypothetical protein
MKTLSNKQTGHLSCVSVADPEISGRGGGAPERGSHP